MRRVLPVLAVLLWSGTATCRVIPNFDVKIDANVTLGPWTPDRRGLHAVVTVGGDGGGRAVVRVAGGSRPDKASAFRTACNCDFALAAVGSVYDGIVGSPDPRDRNRNRGGRSDERDAGNVAERRVDALNDALNSDANRSYYGDRSVLRALASLRLKLYVSSDDPEERPTYGPDAIVRSALVDVATVRRYLAIDCRASAADDDETTVASQWFGSDAETTPPPTSFFMAITAKIIPGRQPRCSLAKVLLEDFIARCGRRKSDILDATVDVGGGDAVTIAHIHGLVKSFRDAGALFWYQNAVMAAIMKIVFAAAVAGARRDKRYLENFTREIRNVHSAVSKEATSYPDRLVDGIAVLSDGQRNGADEIARFHDSLTDVTLARDVTDDDDEPILRGMLLTINRHLDSFSCFQKFYQTPRDDHFRYYVPFAKDNGFLRRADGQRRTDREHSQRVCDFVKNVCSSCFLALMFYQEDYVDKFYDGLKEDSDFSGRLERVLTAIRHYFLVIVKKRSHDVGLMKMAYAVAPILMNSMKKLADDSYAGIETVLDLIMRELNIVAAKHCTWPRSDFSPFDIVDFSELGAKNAADESMKDFYRFSVFGFVENDLRADSVDVEDFNYLNVEFLYTNFVANSHVFKTHEHVVSFYWNGGTKTVRSIFQELVSSFKNVYDLYALYDVCLKFYIAVFYYELKVSLKSKNVKLVNALDETIFPEELTPFVSDVNRLLMLALDVNSDEKSVEAHTDRTEERLMKYNISIDTTICHPLKKLGPCFSPPELSIEHFEKELSSNVKSLKLFIDTFQK